MSVIKIGCCGFPVSRRRYYNQLSLVEVQQTFYEPPSEGTLKRWRDESPSGFEFTLKAWQLITHPITSPTYKRTRTRPGKPENYGFFRDSEETFMAWQKTQRMAEILQARIILFQTPRKFTPVEENIRNMKLFFQRIRAEGFIFVLELRGWPWQKVLQVTGDIGVIPVITEEALYEEIPEGLSYIRLHGRDNYRYRYTDNDLKAILKRTYEFQGPVYVLFNNLSMYEDALRLKKMITL